MNNIETLKKARKSLGLSVNDLCEMLSISRQTWKSWSGGFRQCPDIYVKALRWYCVANGKNVDWAIKNPTG